MNNFIKFITTVVLLIIITIPIGKISTIRRSPFYVPITIAYNGMISSYTFAISKYPNHDQDVNLFFSASRGTFTYRDIEFKIITLTPEELVVEIEDQK